MSRINQGLNYIFKKTEKNDLIEIKKILNDLEYDIFYNMDTYDKVHSISLYKKIKEDIVLKDSIKYLKLALLHDCGKSRENLISRVIKVIFGNRRKINHSKLGYEKIKNIDLELAKLILNHHNIKVNCKLKRFQELDDIS